MKHIVKTVSRFLLLSLTLGCGLFALNQNDRVWTANYAEGESSSSEKVYTAADFADEVEADPEELDVSLVQSNTTETSQSLNFAFKSKTLVVYSTAKNDFIVNIIDSAFTGDSNNPVGDDFDNYDEKSELPILEGEIMFITGATVNRDGGDVTIPAILTLEDTFIVNITTVASHCLTADGAQNSGNNSWYDISHDLKFTKVYLPTSIVNVYENAFTGVPEEVTIYYEGTELPAGFADGWTDRPANVVLGQYGKDTNRERKVGNKIDDLVDEHGRPVNFCLGCKQDGKKYIGEQYDRPLVIQFDKITKENGVEVKKETIFEALPLSNTTGSAYDSVGRISSLDYSRLLNYKLGPNEEIDDNSIIFHNIMKFGKGVEIDTSKRYFAKPTIKYIEKVNLSRLLSFEASSNSTFAGYSMFSLKMSKNLNVVSDKYPEPHSLYLDVKTDFYEQNRSQIESGLAEIRYSLYNLYLSSYRFVYENKNGQLQEVVVPISTAISYQTLEKDADNKISILLKNKDVAPDFSAEKVRTFELVDITVQMDLLTTNDAGSKSVPSKSVIKFKFGYITVVDNTKISVFNWNIFLAVFLVAFVALYAAGSFVLYKVKKEKYKNDEFRRVNDKKYLRSALIYGGGFLVIVYAIIFIFMRAVGFANTIVSFNPTDPLLIAFAIAGMIIGGYFIVLAIKAIKTEKERRRAIRLRLNEDVADDGTN